MLFPLLIYIPEHFHLEHVKRNYSGMENTRVSVSVSGYSMKDRKMWKEKERSMELKRLEIRAEIQDSLPPLSSMQAWAYLL